MGQIRKQLNIVRTGVNRHLFLLVNISLVIIACGSKKQLAGNRADIADHIINYHQIQTTDSTSCKLLVRLYIQESKQSLYLTTGNSVNLIDENQGISVLENSVHNSVKEIDAGRYTMKVSAMNHKILIISNLFFEKGNIYIMDLKLHRGSGNTTLVIHE